MKCEGLGPEQLARRSVPPSTMSLLGLVRHLAAAERDWRSWFVPGEPAPKLYGAGDADFEAAVGEQAAVGGALADLAREQAATDAALAEHPDLAERIGSPDDPLGDPPSVTTAPGRTGPHALSGPFPSRRAIMGYPYGGSDMTDVLVRDVPEDVIAALDSRAARLGLSRSEYLRRRLAQEAVSGPQPVTVEHLTAFAKTFADLADAEIMKGAWE